jgi:hypothetical protein
LGIERLLPQGRELFPEAFAVSRLVRRTFVADHHAIGVTSAHVRLGIVGGDAVAYAADRCLGNEALARNVVADGV